MREALGGPGLSLAQVRVIAWANRRLATVIFVGLALLSALVIWLLPKTYTATATLVINYEINDPLAGREFPLGLLASYTTTQMEIIRSPRVLLPVIDQLRLAEDPELAAGWDPDRSSKAEWVRNALARRLEVQPGVGGQLIFVTASGKQAGQAADIANAVVETYLAQQVQRVNAPAAEEADRYAAQIEELRKGLTAAQQRLAGFQERTGLVSVGGGADLGMDLLGALEKRYLEARNARMEAQIRELGAPGASAPAVASPLIQGLKSQLAAQQASLAQLGTTLGPRHPRIVELRSQIAATQAAINREVGTLSSGNSADVDAALALEEKLGAAVGEQRQRVLRDRVNEAEGAKLLLELESAQSVYKRALDGYEQVKAAAGGRYSNVSRLSEATVPLEATRPNKPKLLLAALAAALLAGVLGTFLYEVLFARRVHCVEDVEKDLGVAVLAEFDPVATPEAAP